MTLSRWPAGAAVLAVAMLGAAAARAEAPVAFTDTERTAILLHGSWPIATTPDPSNRVSGRPAAIAFGKRLFSSTLLSAGRDRSCASCHIAAKGFTDGRKRSIGIARVDRNAPALFNLRLNRWYGWAGARDNLWAQSLRPILDTSELGMTAARVKRRIAAAPALARSYRAVFGRPPAADDPETVLVNLGKALAAFQETIVSGRTPFDEFRDALAMGDRAGIAAYPVAARRGLKLFVGRGRCNVCHFGPNFTTGEFHNIGLPHFAARGRVDKGRYGGIQRLKASRYNLLGRFNDDRKRSTAGFTQRVVLHPRNWGEFRIPSLRNVGLTAPYMHDGGKPTLTAAVRHYSELNEDRLHQDGEKLLRALRLSDRQIAELVAFLETLTEKR